MNDIECIEALVSKGEVFCAEVICKDKKITTLDLLYLLEKYINLTK